MTPATGIVHRPRPGEGTAGAPAAAGGTLVAPRDASHRPPVGRRPSKSPAWLPPTGTACRTTRKAPCCVPTTWCGATRGPPGRPRPPRVGRPRMISSPRW